MALSPVREAAPPWQVLIGPFAADHVEAELDHGAPLLLVPNDLEAAEGLARQFEGRGGGLLYFSRDLLGAEDREVCWYRYSDPRFDGVTAPEALHHLAPNLRLRDLELRPVVRLDSLIHSWANRDPALAALVSAGGGRVWLQSKQPVPIVAGVSRVVEVIGALCWTPLGTPVDPPEGPAAEQRLAEWLEASGFHPAERRPVNDQCAAPSLVWHEDPLRRASARRQQLEGEIARLRQEADGLRQEREGLRQEREALGAALAQAEGCQAALAVEHAAAGERWQAERSLLEAEVAQLSGEGAVLRQDAEALRQQLAVLQEGWEAERQALQADAAVERAALEAERFRLTAEADVLRQESETLRQQLAVSQHGLQTQRQALQAEAAAERGPLEAEIVRLAQEGVVQRQALDSLQKELAAAAAQLRPLEAEIDRLGQENGTLRQEAEALRQEAEACARRPKPCGRKRRPCGRTPGPRSRQSWRCWTPPRPSARTQPLLQHPEPP